MIQVQDHFIPSALLNTLLSNVIIDLWRVYVSLSSRSSALLRVLFTAHSQRSVLSIYLSPHSLFNAPRVFHLPCSETPTGTDSDNFLRIASIFVFCLKFSQFVKVQFLFVTSAANFEWFHSNLFNINYLQKRKKTTSFKELNIEVLITEFSPLSPFCVIIIVFSFVASRSSASQSLRLFLFIETKEFKEKALVINYSQLHKVLN